MDEGFGAMGDKPAAIRPQAGPKWIDWPNTAAD